MDEIEIDKLIKSGRYQDPKQVIGKVNMVEITKKTRERLNNFITKKKISENPYFKDCNKISKNLFESCLSNNFKGYMDLISLFYREYIPSIITELISMEYLNKSFKDDNSRIYSAKESITSLIELSYKQNDFLFGCILVLKKSDLTEIQRTKFTHKKEEIESYNNGELKPLLLNEDFKHIRNSNSHKHTIIYTDKNEIEFKDEFKGKKWVGKYSFEEFFEKMDEIISWYLGIQLSLSETLILITQK